MRKIINGRKYDTGTAALVGSWSRGYQGDTDEMEEELYRKRGGEYFLYGWSGPAGPYGRRVEYSTYASGECIMPMTVEEAREWAERRLDADEYEAAFGEVSEDGGDASATVRVSAQTAEMIRRIALERGCSQGDVVAEAIRKLSE